MSIIQTTTNSLVKIYDKASLTQKGITVALPLTFLVLGILATLLLTRVNQVLLNTGFKHSPAILTPSISISVFLVISSTTVLCLFLCIHKKSKNQKVEMVISPIIEKKKITCTAYIDPKETLGI